MPGQQAALQVEAKQQQDLQRRDYVQCVLASTRSVVSTGGVGQVTKKNANAPVISEPASQPDTLRCFIFHPQTRCRLNPQNIYRHFLRGNTFRKSRLAVIKTTLSHRIATEAKE
jgi:hypothetical protein